MRRHGVPSEALHISVDKHSLEVTEKRTLPAVWRIDQTTWVIRPQTPDPVSTGMVPDGLSGHRNEVNTKIMAFSRVVRKIR
jgi:hypothetical protein